MRAGTIIFLYLLFYCSHHAPFLEVQEPAWRRRCPSVWPRPRCTEQIMHVCRLCVLCFFLCFYIYTPLTSLCLMPAWLHPNLLLLLNIIVNSNKYRFIFVAITAMWRLFTCYVKLLKECADVPFEEKTLYTPTFFRFSSSLLPFCSSLTSSLSDSYILFHHHILCVRSLIITLDNSYISWMGTFSHARTHASKDRTHTHSLTQTSFPNCPFTQNKIQVYKRAANFTSHSLTCVRYIWAIYTVQHQHQHQCLSVPDFSNLHWKAV